MFKEITKQCDGTTQWYLGRPRRVTLDLGKDEIAQTHLALCPHAFCSTLPAWSHCLRSPISFSSLFTDSLYQIKTKKGRTLNWIPHNVVAFAFSPPISLFFLLQVPITQKSERRNCIVLTQRDWGGGWRKILQERSTVKHVFEREKVSGEG